MGLQRGIEDAHAGTTGLARTREVQHVASQCRPAFRRVVRIFVIFHALVERLGESHGLGLARSRQSLADGRIDRLKRKTRAWGAGCGLFLGGLGRFCHGRFTCRLGGVLAGRFA